MKLKDLNLLLEKGFSLRKEKDVYFISKNKKEFMLYFMNKEKTIKSQLRSIERIAKKNRELSLQVVYTNKTQMKEIIKLIKWPANIVPTWKIGK